MAKKKTKKLGVLLLNDIHHVPHAAPIGYALAQRPEFEVVFYFSTDRNRQFAESFAAHFPGVKIKFRNLKLGWFYEFYGKLRGRPFPKISRIFKQYSSELLENDAIVSGDFSILDLMKLKRDQSTKFIMCFHGAGDGAFTFKHNFDGFDLLLVSGQKYQKRLQAECRVPADKIKVIGYPKFDFLGTDVSKKVNLFGNNRPTVIYSPHFNPNLSSWPSWGLHILQMFAKQSSYNLIFAPHVMLHRKKRILQDIPDELFELSHIHIASPDDERASDLSFMNSADIYLGDVSSQVYEFVRRSKPCVFFNSHHISWHDHSDYACWQMGAVVEDLSSVMPAIDAAVASQHKFESVQKKLFAETFDVQSKFASVRGAEVIAEALT